MPTFLTPFFFPLTYTRTFGAVCLTRRRPAEPAAARPRVPKVRTPRPRDSWAVSSTDTVLPHLPFYTINLSVRKVSGSRIICDYKESESGPRRRPREIRTREQKDSYQPVLKGHGTAGEIKIWRDPERREETPSLFALVSRER